jgi:hypothetical protein
MDMDLLPIHPAHLVLGLPDKRKDSTFSAELVICTKLQGGKRTLSVSSDHGDFVQERPSYGGFG